LLLLLLLLLLMLMRATVLTNAWRGRQTATPIVRLSRLDADLPWQPWLSLQAT
jgi:hypothetical protein